MKLFGTGLAFLLLLSCNRQDQQNGDGQSVNTIPAVEAVIITPGILNPYIYKSGTVSGINEAIVVSETQGIIRSVEFELGDEVDSLQELLEVDREETRFALKQAEQQLSTAKMNLEASQRLYKDSIISRSEYEQARSTYNGARAAYESALNQFQNTLIRSPIKGQVASKEPGITVGGFLAPGAAVARIADLNGFKVELAVGEGEIGFIENGAPVKVLIPSLSPDSLFNAQVTAVASGTQPQSGSYSVIVTWKNEGSLVRAGMSASLKIRTSDNDSVLIVPSAALLGDSDSTRVVKIIAGKAHIQQVTIGKKSGNRSVALSGLSSGDTVALSRTSSLAESDSVVVSIVGRSGSWE